MTVLTLPEPAALAGTSAEPAAGARPLDELKPRFVFEHLSAGVLGQDKAVRFVSVAIYKHTTGKVPGNLLMIGNSGTGKTTIMNNIQRLYHEVPEYRPFRAVTIINANLLVDVERMEFQPERLFNAVEQRARAICGDQPTAEALKEAIEQATICIDEIDKMASVVAGKPNPIGVVLQQGLLTLMEGERLAHPTWVWENGEEKKVRLDIDTGNMMFICGGAFEGLYDQVYNRVLKPGSGERLRTHTVRTADGRVKLETRFALSDFLKPNDLFDFGMVPQFMARFDNTVLLEDLSVDVLEGDPAALLRVAAPALAALLRGARGRPRDRRAGRRPDRRIRQKRLAHRRPRPAADLRRDHQPLRVRHRAREPPRAPASGPGPSCGSPPRWRGRSFA